MKNQGIGGREVEIRERVFQVGLGVILETKSVEHRLVMRRGTHARGTHARGTHAKGRINNQFLITGFSMIYGVVNWRREATLPLVVANSIGQREVIKTVIDTGEAWVLISRH
ncbi:MAG: hypothetical protein O9249_00315 [Burkholderiaceae bacterium]|nr:hypothetical protein [Burkholderiaceae bacterium]